MTSHALKERQETP